MVAFIDGSICITFGWHFIVINIGSGTSGGG